MGGSGLSVSSRKVPGTWRLSGSKAVSLNSACMDAEKFSGRTKKGTPNSQLSVLCF